MKKLYLLIFILLVFSLLGSSCVKEFDYNKDVSQTGGSFDKSNPKAAKTIISKDIDSFEYNFVLYDLEQSGRNLPYNNYRFSLKRQAEGASCSGYGYGIANDASFDFEFLAPLSSLDDLQIIIDRHQISKVNGIYKGAIGIPDDLGAELNIQYASGEKIFASDNTGPILTDDANLDLYDFFTSLVMEEDRHLERISHIEARQLVQDWLDQHPDMATPYEPTRIAGMEDEIYTYNAREYYIFDLSGYYWLDILVDLETGEFLARVWEESDKPVEPLIEPLMDYYNRYYEE